MDLNRLSINIKTIASERKISQSKLSELSGVEVTYLNRIFRNKAHNPSLKVIIRIAIALDCTIDELLKCEVKKC